MSLLLPDSGLIFWMALIFAIVFFLLAKFGFPVITGMVEKRNGYIGDSLRLAKEADEKIGNLLKEQARIIEESRTEQNRIMKETAAARDKMINDARVQAKAEAGRLLEEARVQIEAEKESALSDIRRQVAMLSVSVAEKVIRTDLSTEKANIELVERMLDEASEVDIPEER